MGAFIRKSAGREVGDIFQHAGSRPPKGALACNHELLPTEGMFAKLFAVIGDSYGFMDHATYGDHFRIPGKIPLVQMAGRVSPWATYEWIGSTGVSYTQEAYLEWLQLLTVSMTAASTYFHDSMSATPITADCGKAAVPFAVKIDPSATGADTYAVKLGVSKRSGGGLSVLGADVLDGAAYIKFDVTNGIANTQAANFRFCTNGEGGSYTETDIEGLSYFAAGSQVIKLALLLDYAAGTVALMADDGTVYDLGVYDKPTRTVYPYIGYENIDSGTTEALTVGMLKHNALTATTIPGLGFGTPMPIDRTWYNPFDPDVYAVGESHSDQDYPGVWWADAQAPDATNETFLWCIQYK